MEVNFNLRFWFSTIIIIHINTYFRIIIVNIITTISIIIISQEKKDIDTSMRLNSLLLKNDLLAESLFHVFDQVVLRPGTWYL